jgi:hypothetical protein
MIIILEIPHQKPATAWCADSVADACEILARAAEWRGQDADECPEGSDANALSEWLWDNHAHTVLETAEDYRDFFRSWPVQHQALRAKSSVQKALRDLVEINGTGFLKEPRP